MAVTLLSKPRKEPDARTIKMLETCAQQARERKIVSFAIAALGDDGCSQFLWVMNEHDGLQMVGAVSVLQRMLLDDGLKSDEPG